MTQGWPLRNIYLYLVCFVTLMMVLFGFISFLNSVARLAFPIDYSYRQTIMFYLVCFVMLITIIIGIVNLVWAGINLALPYPNVNLKSPGPVEYAPPANYKSQLPKEIIEHEREREHKKLFMQERSRRNTVNEALLSLFRGLAMLLVAFPPYIYHWRKIPMLN
ncbi:MAG: hypothetical protein DDT32_01438 [Syntrophomonadaceae bacterium]|nr:hypothetical protein [Bacillota bacterium]